MWMKKKGSNKYKEFEPFFKIIVRWKCRDMWRWEDKKNLKISKSWVINKPYT